MAYVLRVPPSPEPVSLDEAKAHLRVRDFNDDDDQVRDLIIAARLHFERYTNRSLVTQQWRLQLDSFPWPRNGAAHPHILPGMGWTGEPIRLAHGPVQSIDAVKYVDAAGVTQTLVAGTDYQVDLSSDVGQIAPPLYQPWPWAPRRFAAVTVDFTAGYGAPIAVDRLVRRAILFLVAHWYVNREPVIAGSRAASVEIPLSAQSILDSYVIPILG